MENALLVLSLSTMVVLLIIFVIVQIKSNKKAKTSTQKETPKKQLIEGFLFGIFLLTLYYSLSEMIKKLVG